MAAANLSVMRRSKTLIKPLSSDTPSCSVTLELSAIDRIPVLRCNARTLHVFSDGGADAARIISEAMSKVLVPYYPLAGRLTESLPGQLLQIECSSGEGGVSFVEATTAVTLADVDYFQDVQSIPYDDLLPDTYNYDLNDYGREPLVQIQVTQFGCGGFVIGLIFCHSICDGLGAAQFLNALGEVARGLDSPSINPVWSRDFFVSPNPNPSSISTTQPNFALPPPMPDYRLSHANIDIELDKITCLKNTFHESTGQRCSTFDAVAASFWSARTRGIKFDPETELKLVFFANCREIVDPPLPKGFYGNCFFPVTITASSEWLEQAGLVDVVRRIQEAKLELPNEFAKYKESMERLEGGSDPFAPPLVYTTLFLSEWGRLGFNQVDYGWGPPVHVVPIQGSPIIPVGIMGSLPLPKKGIRLMTWCVEDTHRQGLVDQMANMLSTS